MNWQAISFDWNHIRAFLATVEEGSFSAAARALNTTQPTVGRQVSELESMLGVTLLSRSVRGPKLTDVGTDFLHHCRAMAEAAMLASITANGHSQDVSGEVTVTATDLMSAIILPEVLLPLRLSAPQVRVRIVATQDTKDILHRDADIAIRHNQPTEKELYSRYVGIFRANLYASSDYLDRVGRPRSPRDLASHAFVGTPHPTLLLEQLQNRGVVLTEECFVLVSESGVVVWEYVKAGYGISMLPEALCAGESSLEEALPGMLPLEVPVWLVTHRELQTSKRIRVVFDQIARGLREVVDSNRDSSFK